MVHGSTLHRKVAMPLPPHPILVVSYVDEAREALTAFLDKTGAVAVPCASFSDAENAALKGMYSGMLVDLPSIIKSKGEEKIIACTLANFFPTLRVRTVGFILVPTAEPGIAKQDKSLDDFLHKTCFVNPPKRLREFRRHPVCLSTLTTYNGLEVRGFTLNVSWGGAFIVDVQAELFNVGDQVIILIPEFGCHIPAEVSRIEQWGVLRRPPGIGVRFGVLDETAASVIAGITGTSRESDRDRLTV
jgi:Tfp pilus assembly protein PilZ